MKPFSSGLPLGLKFSFERLLLLVLKFSSPLRAVCSFFSPGPCAVVTTSSRGTPALRRLPARCLALGRLPLHADVLPFLSAFRPPPLTLLFFPFPSLLFQSFPLPFVPSSRSLYPALFLLASPLPCPLPFLPLSLSLCLSVSLCLSIPRSLCLSAPSLSVCRSVSLFLFLSPPLSIVPLGFPSSLVLSLSLSLSFPLSPSLLSTYFCVSVFLSLRLSVSLSLCFMSLYSFVPSALDPQTQGAKKPCTADWVVSWLLEDSFVPSASNPQTQSVKKPCMTC